jgi:hypothetical protein
VEARKRLEKMRDQVQQGSGDAAQHQVRKVCVVHSLRTPTPGALTATFSLRGCSSCREVREIEALVKMHACLLILGCR